MHIPSARITRRIPRWLGLAVAGCLTAAEPESVTHTGLSNASAAVPVGTRWFIAASDESNLLQVYRTDQPGPPASTFDLTPPGTPAGADGPPELDLEGAARIGETAYWIGSHGRNKDGKKRPHRRQLLATRVVEEGDGVRIERIGRPYTRLVDDLELSPGMAGIPIRAASKAAPEEGGLNIEGLAAGPDGSLWIGFRSPLLPGDRCLLVPLLNPAGVLAGEPGRFGPPATLDLEGRAVRDIAWTGREFFLIGGDPEKGGKSRLYRWAGPGHEAGHVPDTGFKHFNPEALAVFGSESGSRLLVLSDDGNRVARAGGEPRFRSFWVTP